MRSTVLIGAALLALAGCTNTSSAITDDRTQALGIKCEGKLAINGAFKQSAPTPADVVGTWPVGTWTFKAATVATNCAQPQALLPQYQLLVSADAEEVQSVSYLTNPNDQNTVVRVTAGGGAEFEGELAYFSDDGKTVITLKPVLFADGHLEGQGTYERYAVDKR